MNRSVFLCAVLVTAALVACSDDSDDGGDQSAEQIGALSENATYALIDDGATGLYDYLSTGVKALCTEEQLEKVMAAAAAPNLTGWKQIKDIEQTGSDATATVIVLVEGEEKDQPWTFVREDESWRITSLPGMAECAETEPS